MVAPVLQLGKLTAKLRAKFVAKLAPARRVPPPRPAVPSGNQPGRKVRQQSGVAGEPKTGVGKANAKQPFVEFRRPLQAKEIADIESVVERRRLVIQHDVVRSGHPMMKLTPAAAS